MKIRYALAALALLASSHSFAKGWAYGFKINKVITYATGMTIVLDRPYPAEVKASCTQSLATVDIVDPKVMGPAALLALATGKTINFDVSDKCSGGTDPQIDALEVQAR